MKSYSKSGPTNNSKESLKLVKSSSKLSAYHSPVHSATKLAKKDDIMAELLSMMRKSESPQTALRKNKMKLPKLSEGWNTRDVSHLRDNRKTSTPCSVLDLPTDIHALSKLIDAPDPRGFHLFKTKEAPIAPRSCMKESPIDSISENLLQTNSDSWLTDTLKRYSLGNPTGRQETENLARWYNLMTEKYMTGDVTNSDDALVICSVCVREIIRQVSVHCVDRGNLLRTVLTHLQEFLYKKYDSNNTDLQQENAKLIEENSKLLRILVENRETFKKEIGYADELKKKDSEKITELKRDLDSINKSVRKRDMEEIGYKEKHSALLKTLTLLSSKTELHKCHCLSKIKSHIKKAEDIEIMKNIRNEDDDNCIREEFLTAETNEGSSSLRKDVDVFTQTVESTHIARYVVNPQYYNVVERYHSVPNKRSNMRTHGYKTINSFRVQDFMNPTVSILKEFSFNQATRSDQYLTVEVPPEHSASSYSQPTIEYNVMSNQTDIYEIFLSIQNEIIGYLPSEIDLESWKIGVILGVEKGKGIGFEECEQLNREFENQDKYFNSTRNENSIEHLPSIEISTRNREQTIQFFNEESTKLLTNETQQVPKTRLKALGMENGSDNELSDIEEFKGTSQKKTQYLNFATSVCDLPWRNLSRKNTQKANKESFRNSRLTGVKSTKFSEFQWHQKRRSTLPPKKSQNGRIIMKNLLEKSYEWVRKRASMSKKMINKIISTVYLITSSKLKSEETPSLIEVVYDELLKKHGLKVGAERKLVAFLCSVFCLGTPKTEIFLRFIYAGPSIYKKNFTEYSFSLYLRAYNFMRTAKIGILLYFDEYASHLIVPSIRAIEYAKEASENWLGKKEYSNLLSWIERESISDFKRINKDGLINCDLFFIEILNEYEKYQAQLKKGLNTLFEGLVTETKFLTDIEFSIMIRFIRSKENTDQSHSKKRISHQKALYELEDILAECLEKQIMSLAEIQKAMEIKELSQEEMSQQRVELDTILTNLKGTTELDYRTLDKVVFNDRLDILQEFAEGLFPLSISLGWEMYSTELKRLKQELKLV